MKKNSKYFANLEKQRAEKKTIYKLIDKNNIEIYDQTHIMSHIHQFYKKLYSKNIGRTVNGYICLGRANVS